MANWNPDETPDKILLRRGVHAFKVGKFIESAEPAKLTVDVPLNVVEPKDMLGVSVYKRFWLGTDDDPRAEQPSTRRGKDWVKYKQFLVACEVHPQGDTEA